MSSEIAQALAVPKLSALPTGLFEASKKTTVIRLRWLTIIASSYLLLLSKDTWFTATSINLTIFIYILTNIALYFMEESLFESSRLYSPLVIFDTLFVTSSLVVSGQVETDFYLVYFIVIILCTIWQDFRGLIVIASILTLLYGVILIRTIEFHDPSLYLRVPFLFVMSVFYGYFTQVVRVEKGLKERAEQEAKDMAMIQSLSQSMPSSLDYQQIIATLGDKINPVVNAAEHNVLIKDEAEGSPYALLFGEKVNGGGGPEKVRLEEYPIVQECLRTCNAVIQRNVHAQLASAEPRGEIRRASFPLSMAVPITFRAESFGAILLGFNDENRTLNSREIQYCQIVAFATAIALSNARKFEELQAEARHRQKVAEELATANRLKSDYLATASHELRTPITTIIGYSALLTEGACGPLVEEQKKVVDRLTQSARELQRLVSQVLDCSRLHNGNGDLAVKALDMATFIEELRNELAPLEARKPFRVRYRAAEGLPPVMTDGEKLKNILVNVIGNAVKFTDDGEVNVDVGMNGSNESDLEELYFVVSDTGIGIPKDQIPHIFDKFRQLESSATRRYEGMGLGLTITKNLVDLLGGRIEVESELGKGSIFKVTVPVAR
jgi:signal transduction histidine kinase